MSTLAVLLVLSFLLQVVGAPDFISLLTPLVVYGVTELVKWAIPKIPGWLIVSFLVPLFSIAVTWISGLLSSPEMNFWIQVAYGLLAVFIREILHQFSQIKKE
jgi:hypothetical protein